MENQPLKTVNRSWSESVKQALMLIVIGAMINALTVLFQFAIEWLNAIPAELPGTAFGVLKYASWIGKSHSFRG